MYELVKRLDQERSRLEDGAGKANTEFGTVRFVVRANGSSISTVLMRAQRILLIINDASRGAWPEEQDWKRLLPEWFVVACAREPTAEEAQAWLARWQSLPWEEQQREERAREWTLAAWLHWMQPDQRAWLWWDAVALDENRATVAIEVEEWPFPWGALAWLFRASGAASVEPEEE